VFTKRDEDDYRTVAPGIRMRTLSFGRRTLMTEFRLLHGHTLPMHSHPQEQTGYLVSGHITLTIGGQAHDVVPGDSWCIVGGVEHGAEVLQDSVAVEVFSPVREDYLPAGASTAQGSA
jgi:quercetin dioxygenase-like cupin family protein